MKRIFVLSVVGVFALLFIGCSEDTSIENPSANNNPGNQVGSAGAPFTGGGAVSVDSLGSCTVCSNDNQDNTIAPNSTAIVWINTRGVDCDSDDYFYQIFDADNLVVECTPLGGVDHNCGIWAGYDFTAPDDDDFPISGVANLLVYCSDACNALYTVGGDGFRLIDNSNCLR